MVRSNLLSRIIAVPFVLVSSAALASESGVGQADSVLLDSLTRSYISSTDSLDGDFAEKGISDEKSRSVGLDVVTSENVDVYAVPLSHGMPMSLLGGQEYLNLNADIPYVKVESPAGNESGLGDIKLGAEYFVKQQGAIVKAAVDLKLPTGDVDKFLGTDSTDIGLSLTGRKREALLGYNATAAYVIRGEGDVAGGTLDYGNTLSLSGGAEYKLGDALWGGVNGAYVRTGTSEINNFETDGLQTFDIIPNVSYDLNVGMSVVASLVIPVYEGVVDGDAPGDEPDREVSMSLSFSSDF